MTVKIKDIANALDQAIDVDPKFVDKVTTVVKEAGIHITVKSEEERKTLFLIAELMDRAEDTYQEQRGQGKDKLSSVLSVVTELAKDGESLFELVKGVTHIVEHLKTIYKLIK